MILQPGIGKRIVSAASIAIMLAPASEGLCQTNPAVEPKSESTDIPEEIVVYGQKNIIHLRADVYRTEEIFLDKFNLLNSDDEFDFKCKYIVLLENRARKRVCVPEFARKYEAKMTAAMIRDGSFQTPPRFRAQLRKYQRLLVTEMLTLMGENAELREAQAELDLAKSAYAAELEERRQN